MAKINGNDILFSVHLHTGSGDETPATMSGTITFTNATKIMTITGLPSIPKELNIMALTTTIPPTDNEYWIRGLDYYKDGFSFGTSTMKMLASIWFGASKNISPTASANGSISEKISNNNNVFSFENGTFTINLTYNEVYYFGENFSYKWTAIF